MRKCISLVLTLGMLCSSFLFFNDAQSLENLENIEIENKRNLFGKDKPTFVDFRNYNKELEIDYFIYRQGSQSHTAIAYIKDLNQRIQKCQKINDATVYEYLSNLLATVLVTGGPFGIRSTGPSANELKVINVSINYIAGLAIRTSDHRHNQKPISRLKEIIEENAKYDVNKNINVKYQSQGVFSLAAASIKNFDISTLPLLPKDPASYVKELLEGSVKFTKDGRVIIRDIESGREFYLLETEADGACWMHSIAYNNGKEATGESFVKTLLNLEPEKRQEICGFGLPFFLDTLSKEDNNLLKNYPNLLKQFKDLKKQITEQLGEEHNYCRYFNYADTLTKPLYTKILRFISKDEVFKALVTRPSTGMFDKTSRSLIDHRGGSVGARLEGKGWPHIWLYLHGLNNLCLNYEFAASGVWSQGKHLNYNFPNKPWTFLYKGTKDIHVSGLWPVNQSSLPNNMNYASESYFNTWHKFKHIC